MEDGHGSQHFVPGAEHGIGGNDLLAQGVEILVGQQDALGGAGGAAGVENHGGIVAGALYLVVIEAAPAQPHEVLPPDDRSVFRYFLNFPAFGEHIAGADGLRQSVPDAGDDDVYDFGVFPDGFKLVVKLIQGNGGDAFGVVQVELNLLLRGQGVDHVGNAAHQIHRIKQVNGLGAVGHSDGDLVAFPDADGFQGFGTGFDLFHQLFVGGGLAHEIKGHILRVFLCDDFHRLEHGPFKIIQMHGGIAHGILPRRFCSNHDQSTS